MTESFLERLALLDSLRVAFMIPKLNVTGRNKPLLSSEPGSKSIIKWYGASKAPDVHCTDEGLVQTDCFW